MRTSEGIGTIISPEFGKQNMIPYVINKTKYYQDESIKFLKWKSSIGHYVPIIFHCMCANF